MILTCPQCDTRYQADAAKFPAAGRKVKCAKCGHAWHQDPPPREPVVEAEEQIMRPEPPQQSPEPEQPAIEEEPRAAAFSAAPAYDAPVATAVVPTSYDEPRQSSRLPARLGVTFGWVLLLVLVAAGVWAAVQYRQQVATAWPQTASLYSAVGQPVNPRGIDFNDVSYKREKQDSQSVLAITGKLVNVSGREQPVPQIRAALADDTGRELYHWTFSAGITTMKPGQSAKFLTRISSPPPAAKHLEVRFARAGE